MTHAVITILPSVIALIWAGMLLGISFLESWVKFKTPGLSRPLGLAVGSTVFRAFNYAQVLLLIILLSLSFLQKFSPVQQLLTSLNAIILFMQIFWLFPKLSQRVDLVIADQPLPKSKVHPLYGFLEISKLCLLVALGIVGII